MNVLSRAILFATIAHSEQSRTDGSPYVVHPIRVYDMVRMYTRDYDILCAAILHDTVEDTEVTLSQISGEFNDKVAEYVDQLTNKYSDHLEHEAKLSATEEHCKHISMEAAHVKLADRWDNLNDLKSWKPARILRYCENTEAMLRGLGDRIPVSMIQVKFDIEHRVAALRLKHAFATTGSGT